MTIRNVAYTALLGAAAVAFIIGSAVPSEAAKKKKAAAAPAPQPVMSCLGSAPGPVCATKGGQKFTYNNACFAAQDGAKSAKAGACKEKKAAKAGGKKKAKKMKS